MTVQQMVEMPQSARPAPADSIATAAQLASLLAAGAAWGSSYCTDADDVDGRAAAQFAKDLGTSVSELVDAMDSTPR